MFSFNFIAGIVLVIYVTSCSKSSAPPMTYSGSSQQDHQKIVTSRRGGLGSSSPDDGLYIESLLFNIMQGWEPGHCICRKSRQRIIGPETQRILLSPLTGEIWVQMSSRIFFLSYRNITGTFICHSQSLNREKSFN
jgi:hypothetical protein